MIVEASDHQWLLAWVNSREEGSHPFWRRVVETGQFDTEELDALIAEED